VDDILTRAGEVTNGNSQFEADALRYLNRVHHTIIAGGSEFNIDVDEPWLWARAKEPLRLELQPKFNTGTVSLTKGSEDGTFSSAPTPSLEGYYLKADGRDEIFRISQHTAGATAFELDSAYTDATGGTLSFKAFKLDYELVPSYITITAKNNRLDFEEVASTNISSTISVGVYTPADLATEIATQLNADGTATYTATYSAATKKFTMTSDLAGPVLFKLQGATGTNQATSILPTLGFDDEDIASAASHVSVYIQGGISRLIEPIRIHRGANKEGNIYGTDVLTMQKREPLNSVVEGNPSKFAVVREDPDGTVVVRFDKYPEEETKVEVEYIPVPRDLKDNTASIPLVPRKFIDLLEFGAASYLLIDKEDGKAGTFSGLAGQKLEAMLRQNRNSLQRTGQNFGSVVPRTDQLSHPRRLIFGEPDAQ